jgi:hypothetical protein
MCGLIISREETFSNNHNCFTALTGYLGRLIEEKDAAIVLLREEFNCKNRIIKSMMDN